MTTTDTITGEPTARLAPARIGRLAFVIFLLALTARLLFLHQSPDRAWPHSVFYEGDAIVWVEWAKALDTGSVFQFDLPIHPPGVAYLLSWLYSGVRETGFTAMKVLWCVMSAAACAFTFLACARWGTKNLRIAGIAALLMVFSFNQYVLATSLNSETPYMLLLTIIVLLTQRASTMPTRWTIIGLGLAHGCAMLLRAEHPLLLGMFALWMILARGPGPGLRFRARAISAAGVCAIALLTCLPWTIHATRATHRFNTLEPAPIAFNLAPVEWDASAQHTLSTLPAFARGDNFAAVNHFAQTLRAPELQGAQLNGSDVIKLIHGEFGWIPAPLPTFVLVSNQGAFSFALANHPASDGGFSRAALAHSMRGSDPTFAFAFPPHNRVFTDGWRVGWESITSDRTATLQNIRRKFERFADGVSSGFGAANLPLNREGVREPVDILVSGSPVVRWWRPFILVLITLGIILALARRIRAGLWLLLIINKLIITLLFYGYARQGASIAPAFFVFIAIAIDTMLIPLDRRLPRVKFWLPAATLIGCIAMLMADVALKRSPQLEQIVGEHVERPDLGANAFQAFNRIEIRGRP